MIRIIYHSADFDGHASGAIAKYYFEYIDGSAYTMHPYNYGQPFPFDEFEKGDIIYFLDVTYQPHKEMLEFEKKYGWQIYVIDHHKSSVDSKILDYVHGGVVDTSVAACELAWNYFFTNIKMPPHIKMLGEYDSWRNDDKSKWNNKIMPFQFGMKLYDTNPIYFDSCSELWFRLHDLWVISQDRDDPRNGKYYAKYNEFIDETLYKGKILHKYQKQQNKMMLNNTAFEATLDGYKVLAANTNVKNSGFFEAKWDEEKYDIMMPFSYNGKYEEYGVSLYTTRDDIDCSVIAKKYGGGGHKQASGFGCKDLKVIDGEIIIGE